MKLQSDSQLKKCPLLSGKHQSFLKRLWHSKRAISGKSKEMDRFESRASVWKQPVSGCFVSKTWSQRIAGCHVCAEGIHDPMSPSSWWLQLQRIVWTCEAHDFQRSSQDHPKILAFNLQLISTWHQLTTFRHVDRGLCGACGAMGSAPGWGTTAGILQPTEVGEDVEILQRTLSFVSWFWLGVACDFCLDGFDHTTLTCF